jgi:hypothetical protein
MKRPLIVLGLLLASLSLPMSAHASSSGSGKNIVRKYENGKIVVRGTNARVGPTTGSGKLLGATGGGCNPSSTGWYFHDKAVGSYNFRIYSRPCISINSNTIVVSDAYADFAGNHPSSWSACTVKVVQRDLANNGTVTQNFGCLADARASATHRYKQDLGFYAVQGHSYRTEVTYSGTFAGSSFTAHTDISPIVYYS